MVSAALIDRWEDTLRWGSVVRERRREWGYESRAGNDRKGCTPRPLGLDVAGVTRRHVGRHDQAMRSRAAGAQVQEGHSWTQAGSTWTSRCRARQHVERCARGRLWTLQWVLFAPAGRAGRLPPANRPGLLAADELGASLDAARGRSNHERNSNRYLRHKLQ